MKARIILIISLLCAFAGKGWAQWDGNGTSASPYLIKTTGDLVTLATNSKTNTYYQEFFRLENDLDMNGVEIGTIGNLSSAFRGTFDGNRHAIRNLTINKPDDSYVGLFGDTYTGCTIKNLILDGANITGNSYVAVLAGQTYNCTIENCFVVNSSVACTDASGGHYVGIISGNYWSNCTLSGNYYYNCSVTIGGSTINTTDIGTGKGDRDGAVNGIGTWLFLQAVLTAASTDADNPTVITLAADITAEASDTYLELKGGRHVILDLNGHTLDRHMTAAQEGKGYVIQVFGSTTSLTIRDNSTAQTGTVTGGWSRYGAGCIYVINNATLRLESGTISGNRVTQNGGAIALYGNFYMTGGTITGNAANIGNLSSVYCGALYFSDSSHFYMSGGSITGNYCGTTDSGAAGIGCYAGMGHSHVHLSGSYDISGNQQGTYDNGTWSNLTPSDILNHERITYDIDGAISPSQPARMIVDAHYSKATFTSGWATYMSGKDPELVFTLATPNEQGIGLNSDGEATIGDLHTITLADGLTASTTQAAPGRPITLSGGTPSLSRYIVTYNDGKAHTDYYMADANGQATFQMPNANASISSEAAVTYIDENGDLQTCTNFTLIESHEGDIEIGDSDNKEKWYAVSGPVTIHGRLQIFDQNIHLILCDGASFTVTNATSSAIRCSKNVTIYGQSAQSGTITATATSSEYPCIDVPSHTLTINGGTINATCDNASAIYTRTLIINRGTISVTGYYGINCSNSVTINGGTVNAHGSDSYYAIYGNSNVTINGGIIDAESPTKAIYAQNGILTLGWTNATDRITASSYYTKYGSICVKEGQILTDGANYYSGTLDDTQLTAMANQTLRPAPSAGDSTLDLTANQATFAGQTHYWTTFYHPMWSYTLPAGAQAFYMKDDHALYRVGDGSVVPAGCAVVIMAESASIELTVTTADAPTVTGNILQGTSAATTAPAGTHVMGKVSDTFGFFEYSGEIPANKAYYVE